MCLPALKFYLLYPQHFQSIIFFVYCVVSFCSTSSTRICVARLWKTRTKKIPKSCVAVLEDVVFMLSYVSRWGKNRSRFNRPPTHPELCFHSKINFILMKILWKVYQHMCAPRISPFAASSGDQFSVFPPQISFIYSPSWHPLTSAFFPYNFCALCTVDLDFNKSP